MAENVRRAAQIRATLNRLPAEFERRQAVRYEATRDRLAAQLKAVEARSSGKGRWGRKRLGVRTARLRAELARVERALAGVVAPPLHEGRYLRRAAERAQAESAKLWAALVEVNRQLAEARATGDGDRVRALRAHRAGLQAQHEVASSEVRKLWQVPGAAVASPTARGRRGGVRPARGRRAGGASRRRRGSADRRGPAP